VTDRTPARIWVGSYCRGGVAVWLQRVQRPRCNCDMARHIDLGIVALCRKRGAHVVGSSQMGHADSQCVVVLAGGCPYEIIIT
jgi:hypothetical protein